MLWACDQLGNPGYSVFHTPEDLRLGREDIRSPTETLWKQPRSPNHIYESVLAHLTHLITILECIAPLQRAVAVEGGEITTGFIHTPKLCLNKGNACKTHYCLWKKVLVSQVTFPKKCPPYRGLSLVSLLGNKLESSTPGTERKEAGLSGRKVWAVMQSQHSL